MNYSKYNFLKHPTGEKMRYIFLNALPLNALPRKPLELKITPVKLEVLKQLVPLMKNIENYIRHQSTITLLNKLLGLQLEPSNKLYSYQEGDIIYVITLNKPTRGIEIKEVCENDITIWQVEVFNQ